MTGSTDAADSQESKSSDALGTRADASKLPKRKRVLRKVVIAFGAVVVLLVVAYFVTVNFVARPYRSHPGQWNRPSTRVTGSW